MPVLAIVDLPPSRQEVFFAELRIDAVAAFAVITVALATFHIIKTISRPQSAKRVAAIIITYAIGVGILYFAYLLYNQNRDQARLNSPPPPPPTFPWVDEAALIKECQVTNIDYMYGISSVFVRLTFKDAPQIYVAGTPSITALRDFAKNATSSCSTRVTEWILRRLRRPRRMQQAAFVVT